MSLRNLRVLGLCCSLLLSGALAPRASLADDVSGAMQRGAEEYLAALASGSVQSVASAIHPAELDRLRLGMLTLLRDDAAKGDTTSRARLFGPAMPLSDVERMTSAAFFSAIGRRLNWSAGRAYQDVKGLVAVRDGKERVHVMVKGRQPKDRGKSEVVEVVTLLPYGKDWKASIPTGIEAQIEDLLAGRTAPSASSARAAAESPGAGGVSSTSGNASGNASGNSAGAADRNSPEIITLLDTAEKALIDGRCDQYYRDSLSPAFRKAVSARALDTLINGCRNSIGNREVLIAALRVVRRLSPRYEFDGNRASYDVAGQGLPFDRFVLERIERRWYIAE